eukprot:EG_transcript_17021
MPVDSFEQGLLMAPPALSPAPVPPAALPSQMAGHPFALPSAPPDASPLAGPSSLYMAPPPMPHAQPPALPYLPSSSMLGLAGGNLGLLSAPSPLPLGPPGAGLGAGLWPPGLAASLPPGFPLSVSLPGALPPSPLGGGLVFPNAFLAAATGRPPPPPRRPSDAAGGNKPGSYGDPCEHRRSWKRLRAKRGVVYFMCQQCHAKWRVRSEDQEGRPKADGHDRSASMEHCMQYGDLGNGTVRMGDQQGKDDRHNGLMRGTSPPHNDGTADRDRGRSSRYKRSRSGDESDDGDYRDGRSPLRIATERSPSPPRSPNLRFPLDYGEPDARSDSD